MTRLNRWQRRIGNILREIFYHRRRQRRGGLKTQTILALNRKLTIARSRPI